MLLELAKPATLLSSILACFAAFHAAFLGTATSIEERIGDTFPLLVLALGISLISGMIFLLDANESAEQLATITTTDQEVWMHFIGRLMSEAKGDQRQSATAGDALKTNSHRPRNSPRTPNALSHPALRAHSIEMRLWKTLPVQIFCWSTCLIAVLFLASWYVETHLILYRDLHYGVPGARSTSSFIAASDFESLRIH